MVNFTSILLGFFLAINFSTILGQTGDWSLLSSGVITAFVELTTNVLYTAKKKLVQIEPKFSIKTFKSITIILTFFNNVKVGFLYGFFVEAFKLGS